MVAEFDDGPHLRHGLPSRVSSLRVKSLVAGTPAQTGLTGAVPRSPCDDALIDGMPARKRANATTEPRSV